jgi:type I restriction-modification system DNA methylase subunit
MKTQTKEKVKKLGQVFTPPELVNEMLDKIPSKSFTDPTKTFLDNSCGAGAFLVEVKKRLMANGIDENHILENQIYGVDLDPDAVEECIKNLNAEGKNHNIIIGDALAIDYGLAFNLHKIATWI